MEAKKQKYGATIEVILWRILEITNPLGLKRS